MRNKSKKKLQRKSSIHASNQQNESATKWMYILAFITLGLFILTPLSQAFLRCNFVSGTNFDPYTICYFSYFMYYFPYSMGQWTLSTLFLYRLHVTFFKSQYKIQRRTNIVIASIFGTLSLLFVCILLFSKKIFVNKNTKDNKYTYCTNMNEDSINYLGWLGGYAIQTIYNIYVLYSFLWRLYKIRKSMLNSFDTERSQTPSQSDINAYKRILKLNRLMIKMSFLVIFSILFTWFYIFVGIITINIAFAVSYSIIIDTICMWLLFSSISDKYWNYLVYVFYYPCFCYKLCPSIKNDQDTDIKHMKSHIDVSSGNEEAQTIQTQTIDTPQDIESV